MSFKALGFPEDIHNFNESMPVQDCEALNRLFLFLFLFCFFLWNAESSVKFEYGGNSKTGNPFVTAGGEHESSCENQCQCSEYLLDAQAF